MFTNPYLTRELARVRQREMLAQAHQQRLGRSSPQPSRPIMSALVIELRVPDLHASGSHLRPRFPW